MKTWKKLACLSLVACCFCFALTGCGNDKNGSTSGNNDNNVVEDTADNVGDAAGDLVEGAGNAVEDVADGVGNAVDDLTNMNGFDNYEDAHAYLLETLGNYHADAQFDIREEDKNLTDYKRMAKGYRFKLYDTTANAEGELFGEFIVDAETGKIYKLEGDTATEYPGTTENGMDENTSSSTTENGTNTGAGAGATDGNETDAGSTGTDANGGNGTAGNTNGGTAGAAQ